MIISVNWLKQFTQIDASIDELAEIIGARLVEIEGVETIGGKYKDVRIARVVECAPVEDSDHLNLTKIDEGGVVEGVERDENGLVQVVCGAPNVRAGMLVAWLPPGSTVPETAGDDEPFVLGARKLRGHMSNGMLASARELDLFDDHEGIIEVDKDVAPGSLFLDAYALDDSLLDIENKSLTHRPDAFGVLGFAREVAAIAGKGFRAPDWFENLAPSYGHASDSVPLSVAIDDPQLASRYQAVVLGGLRDISHTPLEIQTYLSRSGVRPISPIVDVTNYLMLLTGQPLHAFDYDKVVALAGSSHLHVREGHANETLALLDGRNITLSSDDIVIAAGDKAIALAGAMGGAETEIDGSTKRIIIESATFNLYNLRRTQMRHGIFSEAITRFTKGQPAALTAPVLSQALVLLQQWCGATRVSDVADDYATRADEPTLTLPIEKINDVLGARYSVDDVAQTLRNVQFSVDTQGTHIAVTPSYWRTDVHIDEDIIEEVGRLNGFDSIEPTLPQRSFTAIAPDDGQLLRQTIRQALAAAGANEVLTYSFVHGDLLSRAGQSPDEAFGLGNAISPDLQYYRLSLTPSLLDKVSMNLRQKFDEFALFEFGKTHVKQAYDETETDVPAEFSRIALTYAANTKRADSRGSAYYTARHYLEALLGALHISDLTLRPLVDESSIDVAATPFEPRRAAVVYAGSVYLGIVGEYKRTVQKSFKLPNFSAGFELLLAPLQPLVRIAGSYAPLSRYPSSDFDSTFQVPATVPFATVMDVVRQAATQEQLSVTVAPQDIYVPTGDTATKNISLHFNVTSYDHTLSRDEVNAVTQRLTTAVIQAGFNASVI